MFLQSIFESNAIPVLERAVSFAEARNKVLAANIANAETPGWRRKDLRFGRFQEKLQEAIRERNEHPGRFVMNDGPSDAMVDEGPFVLRRNNAGMLRHDGNNVDMEREMALLAQNSLYHQTLTALLRQKYGSLRSALSEGRSA